MASSRQPMSLTSSPGTSAGSQRPARATSGSSGARGRKATTPLTATAATRTHRYRRRLRRVAPSHSSNPNSAGSRWLYFQGSTKKRPSLTAKAPTPSRSSGSSPHRRSAATSAGAATATTTSSAGREGEADRQGVAVGGAPTPHQPGDPEAGRPARHGRGQVDQQVAADRVEGGDDRLEDGDAGWARRHVVAPADALTRPEHVGD